MVIIPLQAVPSQILQIVLDGQETTLRFYWRWGRVYCDLTNGTNKIVSGGLCLNLQPVNPFPSAFFSGKLYFLDMLGNEPPQWEGLGTRWVLFYLSDGETLETAFQTEQAAS